jgi:hypothetical protein
MQTLLKGSTTFKQLLPDAVQRLTERLADKENNKKLIALHTRSVQFVLTIVSNTRFETRKVLTNRERSSHS